MLNDLYTFSVPVFLRGHAVLSELLRKGEAHAAGYKITPSALLTERMRQLLAAHQANDASPKIARWTTRN